MPEDALPYYDLRTFLRNTASSPYGGALTVAPETRKDTPQPVELLDPMRAVPVSAEPADLAGFVDGIQASICVTYRDHRPVYLSYVAAGAVRGWGDPVATAEELAVYCAGVDHDWAAEKVGLGAGDRIPLHCAPTASPPEVEQWAYAHIGNRRDTLERELIESLVAQGVVPLVVDGDLRARTANDGLIGVAKTHRTRYLPDEGVLYGMQAGWRSPRFRVPAGNAESVDRFSCYLRLHNPNGHTWSHGLVRLETYDADLLDSACAAVFLNRQGPTGKDARWDRHLAPVRACEDYLRALRPQAFSTLR